MVLSRIKRINRAYLLFPYPYHIIYLLISLRFILLFVFPIEKMQKMFPLSDTRNIATIKQ